MIIELVNVLIGRKDPLNIGGLKTFYGQRICSFGAIFYYICLTEVRTYHYLLNTAIKICILKLKRTSDGLLTFLSLC